MKQLIWIGTSMLLWALSTGHAISAPAQGKVVGVVYDNSASMPAVDAEWLRAHKVNVRFFLIGSDKNKVAEVLTRKETLHILAGGEGKTVTEAVGKRAETLNGFGNLTPEGSGREVLINAPFPLRRVMVLRQDSSSGELGQVAWGEKSLDWDSLRKPRIIVQTDERLPARDLPISARVY